MHTEGVAFAPRKSPRARCAKSNILAQILNHIVVYLERRVESLAVCMPQLNNTCANFYAKDLTLNAGRRFRCAWAITQKDDIHLKVYAHRMRCRSGLEPMLIYCSMHIGRVAICAAQTRRLRCAWAFCAFTLSASTRFARRANISFIADIILLSLLTLDIPKILIGLFPCLGFNNAPIIERIPTHAAVTAP